MNYFKKSIIYGVLTALIFQILVWANLYAYQLIDDNSVESTVASITSSNEFASYEFDEALRATVLTPNDMSSPQGTIIKSDITVNTIWSPEGSPYIINADFYVRKNATLTILPGTTIHLDPNYQSLFKVEDGGGLVAEGEPGRSILITNISKNLSLITFEENSKILINHCNINKVYKIKIETNNAHISNCIINNISEGTEIRGEISQNKKIVLKNLVFSGDTIPNEYILKILNSDPEMSDVKILKNYVVYVELWGSYGLNPSFPYTYTLERGNYRGSINSGTNIKLVVDPGTNFYDTPLTVWGQLIANGTPELPIRFTSDAPEEYRIKSNRLSLYSYDKNSGGNELSHCIIEYGSTGIFVDSDIEMSNCEVKENDYGVVIKENSPIPRFDLHYNKFFDNKFNISNESVSPKTIVSATYNYWGHPTGPKHVTNPPGKGASVTDDVVFKPFLRYPSSSPAKRNLVTGVVGDEINRNLSPEDEDEISILVDSTEPLMVELKSSGNLPIAFGQIAPIDGSLIEDNSNSKRIYISSPSLGVYKFAVVPNGANGNSQYTFRLHKVVSQIFTVMPNIDPQSLMQFRVTGVMHFANQEATLCSASNAAIVKGTIFSAGEGLGIFQVDLSKVPTGTYNLCINWKDGKQIISDAISIKTGLAGKLSAEIEFPKIFRLGRDAEAILHYVNVGDAPILAPAFIVSGTNALVRLNPRYEYTGTLAVMGYGQTTPINWLMPGEHRKIAFNFKPQTTSAKITLETLTTSSTAAFPWTQLRRQMRPLTDTSEWDETWSGLTNALGVSWGSVIQSFNNLSILSRKPSSRTLIEELAFWQFNRVYDLNSGQNSLLISSTPIYEQNIDQSIDFTRTFGCFAFVSVNPLLLSEGLIKSYDYDKDIKLFGANANEVFDPKSFDPSAPTFIITHGNMDSQHYVGNTSNRYINISNEIIGKMQKLYGIKPNIIRVDWQKPAEGWYAPAKPDCKNIYGENILERVGRDAADKILDSLDSAGKSIDLSKVVFVGHSFGNPVGYEMSGKMRSILGGNTPKPSAIVLDAANRELSHVHTPDYGKNFDVTTSAAFGTDSIWDEENDLGLTYHNVDCSDTANPLWGATKAHGYGIDTWAPRAIQNCWNPYFPKARSEVFGVNCGFAKPIPLISITGIGRLYSLAAVGSFDPNDKLLWNNFVQPGDTVRFTIRFENFMTATAPAQDVLVVDQLNPMFDWTSVKFERVGFGNTIIQVNQNAVRESTSKINVRDYRPEITKMLGVNISMKADPKSGQIVWNFTSIDPQTGQPPTDPLAGFLPPNDKTGRGDGFVTFEVRVKENVPLGSKIPNEATIIFDVNDPINTPSISTIIGSPSTKISLPFIRKK